MYKPDGHILFFFFDNAGRWTRVGSDIPIISHLTAWPQTIVQVGIFTSGHVDKKQASRAGQSEHLLTR